jgi:putative phage-type endonuclease
MKYFRQPPETAAEFIACKNRPEWLRERQKSLGTSDIGALLGISTFRKPLQVYAEKRLDPNTGQPLVPEGEPSEAMLWGIRLEDIVRHHYAQETGRRIFYREHSLFRHPKQPFHCSLDGIAVDRKTKESRILEIKTASSFTYIGGMMGDGAGDKRVTAWGEEGSDDIPLSYVAGVQWSMGILGPDWMLADVAVLFGGNKFRVYTVERDDAIIKQMQEEALTFWMRTENGQPPEVTDGSEQTRKAIEALYRPREEGEILEADLKVKAAMYDLDNLRELLKKTEAEKKRLENIICAAIGKELGITDGKITYKWKTQERKGYTVEPSTCRVLRPSKNKETKNGKEKKEAQTQG